MAARFFGGHGARKLRSWRRRRRGRWNGSEEGRRRAKQLIRRRPGGGDVPPTRRGRSPDFLRADRRRMPPPPPCPFSIRPTCGEESTWTPLFYKNYFCATRVRRCSSSPARVPLYRATPRCGERTRYLYNTPKPRRQTLFELEGRKTFFSATTNLYKHFIFWNTKCIKY